MAANRPSRSPGTGNPDTPQSQRQPGAGRARGAKGSGSGNAGGSRPVRRRPDQTPAADAGKPVRAQAGRKPRGQDPEPTPGRGDGGKAAGRGQGAKAQGAKGQGAKGQGAKGQRGSARSGSAQSASARPGAAVDAPREIALEVVNAVRTRAAYANLLLPQLLKRRRLDTRDAAFTTELTYGTLRAQGQLDQIIAAAANRPASEIDPELLDVLRLGVYQLLRTRVEAHAAVSTSVDLAKEHAGHGAAKFANGVLRAISRRTLEEWFAELLAAPRADGAGEAVAAFARLALTTAHPRWIVQAFADALGSAVGELEDALIADDRRPGLHLAALPGVISQEELALITGGSEGELSPYTVYLDGGVPGEIEAIREGMAIVQDEGSTLIAQALAEAPVAAGLATAAGADVPEPAERWLDLCAGPGGKTAILAALAEASGAELHAVEVAEHRAALVSQAIGNYPVTVHTADGRASGLPERSFTRILVDAPCTGLGALRRRPEARWRRQPEDVAPLVVLQKELLEAAAKLLAPGGVIVYSTCSPVVQETEAVVRYATRRLGLRPLDTGAILPRLRATGEPTAEPPATPSAEPWIQLWPHRHGTDAMFLCALTLPLEQPIESTP